MKIIVSNIVVLGRRRSGRRTKGEVAIVVALVGLGKIVGSNLARVMSRRRRLW